jgi:hypothetical protein
MVVRVRRVTDAAYARCAHAVLTQALELAGIAVEARRTPRLRQAIDRLSTHSG